MIKRLLKITVFVLSTLMLGYCVVKIFMFDTFIVRGCSMEPTYYDGDRVYVNKLLMGARVYTDLNFSKSKLHSVRVLGLRNVVVGDELVVNYPYASCGDTINFKINKVYLKRCYGGPGDTISIIEGFYRNSNIIGNIGPIQFQSVLNKVSDSLLKINGVALEAYPLNNDICWTIKNFGPLYVPHKGDIIELTKNNITLYDKLIQYETGEFPQICDDKIMIAGKEILEYTFTCNWYFLGGDNVVNSEDSRYIGLIPEDYIIGIVNK